MLTLGVLSRSEYFGKKIRQSVSLSANAFLARFLDLTVSYNMMNQTYNNLGVGLGIKGGPLQIYVITDKIPISFTKVEVSDPASDFADLNGVVFPTEWSTFNVRFGVNLLFGCKRRRFNDKPMIF